MPPGRYLAISLDPRPARPVGWHNRLQMLIRLTKGAPMPTAVRRLLILSAAAALTGSLAATAPIQAPASAASGDTSEPAEQESVADLGEPVHKTQTLSSATGTGPDGEPLGYYLVEGNPTTNAEFTVMNLRTGENVLQTRLPHGTASQRTLAQSPADGTVYFGTSEVSHLYRYTPGGDELEYLGDMPDGQRVWEMAVDEQGTPWIGTYPGGQLFSMDPDTGELTDHGQALAGEQYIKAIEPAGDTIYLGTESNAHLVAFDRESGEFTDLETPEEHTATNIEALNLHGDLLFMGSADMHVLDTSSGEWVDHLLSASPRVSPPAPDDEDGVYLRLGGEVHRYDLQTLEATGTGWAPNATPESWAWTDLDDTGPWLTMTYWNEGRTYAYNPATQETYYQVPDLLGAGAQIISLGTGPQGDIFTGAYLSPPGMGRFDPDTEQFELLAGSGQIEGYGTFGDTLVFGRYPQGSLWHYDPAEPWETGTNPAEPLEIGDGQSRPQAFVELTSMPGTVAVGSVPTGGQHGGAITLWQPDEGTHEVYRHVVTDQTPVALIEQGDLLIGGTSIEGGYGIDPVTDEAVLFAFDPVSGQNLWQSVPVPGAPTISALAFDDQGHLWGIAGGGTIFEFDVEERQTVRTIELDAQAEADRYGNAERLLIDNGRIFGSAANQLFVLDPITEEVTTLHGGPSTDPAERVHELAQDRRGDLYVVGASTRLLRWEMPEDDTAPEVAASVQPANPGPGRSALVRLSAQDDQDERPVIDYRVDGGQWSTYTRAIQLERGQSIDYRAIDQAWNSSQVQTVSVPE